MANVYIYYVYENQMNTDLSMRVKNREMKYS